MKFLQISWNFMKFQENNNFWPICRKLGAQKPWYSLGKTMIWAQGTPKAKKLSKVTGIGRNLWNSLKMCWNVPNSQEKTILVISVVSGRIAPLRNLWICFVFQWFGELLDVRAREGVRFPFSYGKSKKSMKFIKFLKFHENWEKSMKIVKLDGILNFSSAGRKHLLNL